MGNYNSVSGNYCHGARRQQRSCVASKNCTCTGLVSAVFLGFVICVMLPAVTEDIQGGPDCYFLEDKTKYLTLGACEKMCHLNKSPEIQCARYMLQC